MAKGTCEYCGKGLTGRQRRFCCRRHGRCISKREARERGARWAQNQPIEDRMMDLTCAVCRREYRGHAQNQDDAHRFTYCSPTCHAEGKRLRYGKGCEHGLTARAYECPACSFVERAQSVQVSMRRTVKADPCAYCGELSQGLDHIEPQSKGGKDEWENWTGCCRRCNTIKSTLPLLLALRWIPVNRAYHDQRRQLFAVPGGGGTPSDL